MLFKRTILLYLFFVSFLINSLVNAQDSTNIVISDSANTAVKDSSEQLPDTLVYRPLERIVDNKAIEVGEKLTFNIRYGFIKAGEAVMTVQDQVYLQDSIPAFHIVTTARSAKFFDGIYKVRDKVETFIDARGFFSWKFNKQLREGGYKLDLAVNYDQHYGKARVERIRYHKKEPLEVRSQKSYEVDIPEYVMDVLSAFYYVRTQRLNPGEPIYISNHDNKKIYDLQVIVQKREEVDVPAGKFNCIKIKPQLLGEAIFKQKGELWVWLTDDEYKIPVLMKSKVAVGSITTELKKIEGLSRPLTSRLK